jgi:HK97 family phage prohead protease
MPFGKYENFEDCVAQNQDKDDPEAYCAAIKKQIEGEEAKTHGPTDQRETRIFMLSSVELEQRDDDLAPRIILHPVIFDVKSEPLMFFREIIRPEAIDRTIREKTDVRALIDHDPSKILGRLSAGTLRLSKERKGLRAEIDPPNTSYARDLIVSIRRGDITGGSFSFRVITDQWHTENDEEIREVLDMEVYEVSAVTFPAYPQTNAALRSLEHWRGTQRRGRSLELARRQQRAAMNR